MNGHFLTVSLLLAYGPFALILAVYLSAVTLKCFGRPHLLQFLVERTSEQKPVIRAGDSHH